MNSQIPKFTNQLIHESSPYLLQHAHNPVDWYAWGEAAFEKAKTEDKPILVSIGYAACHWCHVMEHESFENEEVAAFMNQHFVNVKIDREERPDIDQIYMDALAIMGIQGGWPLNCFLTPDGRPFYGGTYFPPTPMYNRPSWHNILTFISQTFQEERDKVEKQANQLTYYIQEQDKNIFKSFVVPEAGQQAFTIAQTHKIFKTLQRSFDTQDGGFGGAPKFPSSMAFQYLLAYHYYSGETKALNHVLFSLKKMIFGGIYDQLGGGFARYATDKKWLIPHFEKMLYDNALLVSTLANAFKITKDPLFKKTIEETLDFVLREMTHPQGGFYASYDADSEGVEGKFYVWSKAEIDAILGADAPVFNYYYGVTEQGNWEHTNILERQQSLEAFAKTVNRPVEEVENTLAQLRQKLFMVREKRVKPGLDDKILLNWNALMVSAFAHAYEALGNEVYLKTAETTLHFLLEKFKIEADSWEMNHTYKNGVAKYPAFLDDYAFLVAALIDTYQINFDENLLHIAAAITEFVIERFSDDQNIAFFYTKIGQQDVIVRKKAFYDNAIPSGNSTMASNLQRLGLILDKADYTQRAVNMLKSVEASVEKYAASFARWATVLLRFVHPVDEIAVTGKAHQQLVQQINEWYLPNKIVMATAINSEFPLLKNRTMEQQDLIFLCRNHTCQLPVQNLEDLKALLSQA